MVVLDDIKNLVLYKKPFFLPIDENDKKHNSAIMLLTPNYQSSINAMKAPYTINRRYFESYYLEKNVSRYIGGRVDNMLTQEQYQFNINESDLNAEDRSKLPNSEFGLPSQRRYPIHDQKHVLLAIKFFNYVEEEYEKELADNIIKKVKEFQMEEDINVTEKNRFYPYWNSIVHECGFMIESVSSTLKDDYVSKGNKKISSFKQLELTEENVKKYKSDVKYLSHFRTGNDYAGYIWIDDNSVVAACSVNKDTNIIQAIEISKQYQGYGLSKQILDICKSLDGYILSVNKSNDVAISVYKKYGFYTYKESDSMYFMVLKGYEKYINESMIVESAGMDLYHISERNLDGSTLKPQIPNNYMTKNGYEDGKTPRVCFTQSIDQSLMAMSQNLKGKEYYIHIPNKKYSTYKPSVKEVPDSKLTGEVWIKENVDIICIGKITVEDSYEKGYPYTYGDNTAELYKWKWKWVEQYNESTTSKDSRQKLINDVNKSLDTIGLKAHISKTGQWGSDQFLNGAESLCIGSFKKEEYDNAYKQLSSDLKGKCKISKDNYFTIFVKVSESADMEDDLEFSYYFSDELKKKFNDTVDMSNKNHEIIDEYTLMEQVQEVKKKFSSIPYLTKGSISKHESLNEMNPVFIVSIFEKSLDKAVMGISFSPVISRINIGENVSSLYNIIKEDSQTIMNVNVVFETYDDYCNISQNTHAGYDSYMKSLLEKDVYRIYTGLTKDYHESKIGNAVSLIKEKLSSMNESYIEEATPVHIESCTGIIIDKRGRILVNSHKRSNTLSIPGGKMNPGESETQTLLRELKEELGIDVIAAREIYDFTFGFNYIDDKTDYICTDHTYMIKDYTGEIKNVEHEKHDFVKFMSVNEIMMYPKKKSEVLKRFIAQYGSTYSTDPSDYTSKFLSGSNVVYTGYSTDIKITDVYINQKSLKHMFEKCAVDYPKYTITIIVSGVKTDYGYISENNITVLSKSAFEKEFKEYSYADYIKFISAVYVYHTVNPNIIDSIVYPLAMYMSGNIDQLLNTTKDKYDMERVFKYIHTNYGHREIISIVKYNDIRKLYQYGKEMISKGYYLRESMSELLDIIHEQDEKKTEPMTMNDVQDIGAKITRKIKQATVYKMNKIRRDIERGNVGSEKRGTVTTLQKIQNGDLGKIEIPEAPNINSASSGVNEPKQEAYVDRFALINMTEGVEYVSNGTCMFFLEDGINYNASLKKSLYDDRIRNSKEILEIYKRVKSDCPFIRWTFTDIKRYDNRNMFFDMSFYNESYFKNSVNDSDKISLTNLKVYKELVKRLINDSRFQSYNKKTIFIPILDWRHNSSTRMWIYKEDLNPISIIYNMIKNNPNDIIDLFGDCDVIFMGAGNYFKVNFSQVDIVKERVDMKMINLLRRIITLGTNGRPDPDPEDEPINSAKGIAMDIVDKVEKSQNIEIKSVKSIMNPIKTDTPFEDKKKPVESNTAVKKIEVLKVTEKDKEIKPNAKMIKVTKDENLKSTKVDKPDVNPVVNAVDKEKQKDQLIKMIAKAAEDVSTSDGAMEKLDEDKFKELLELLKNQEEENVRVSKTRAARIVELSNAFRSKEVSGKSIKDLLSQNPNDIQLPKTSLPVASISKNWDQMTFVNFDKTYDPDSDIVKMLDNMKNWSFPVAVRNINVTDNSSSEDYVNLWDIDCEDYKGSRFKLKVDIPKFINDKFMKLRGNEKTLMIQSTMMPIIKTDLGTCQIIGVGGYNKIFVRRYGSGAGKSMPTVDKLIKTLGRYDGGGLKFTLGDNTKVCNKYELPIDYIDLASYYDIIETDDIVLYFNQDEFRRIYVVDDSEGLPLGIRKGKDINDDSIIYYNEEVAKDFKLVSGYIAALVMGSVSDIPSIVEIYNSVIATGKRYMYSRAKILNTNIPLVVICAYVEGLITTLQKAKIDYSFKSKLDKNDRYGDSIDYIKFADGYLLYENTYTSTMLLNGLKGCDTESYSIKDINSKEMYMDFLHNFGTLKSDGLDNSYDCTIDPITKEILEIYKLPTDYVSVLLYANALLADNKFVKHSDMSVRRLRRKELIAGYFYKALCAAYESYASQIRHTRKTTKMTMKQSAVIDMILSKDPSTSDLSINNCINDVESANSITSKGLVGMNMDRSYSLDKRGYDTSMLNVIGMSTVHSGNAGINRQATLDCNIMGARGFVVPIDNNTDKLSTTGSLTVTEAMTPFGTTHDDPFRTNMTYIQKSKHMVRTVYSDPLLVTNGADEAMPYLVSDIFAFKAKKDGKIIEMSTENERESYMVIEYKDGSHDFVDLSSQIKKNSDGGYEVPMKLDTDLKVGSSVKAGDVVAYDQLSFSKSIGESGNLAANNGTLAKIAIMNNDEGIEDSAAATAAFCRKLGTEVIVKHVKVIDKDANVFLMKKIGDQVVEGDTLLSYQTSFDDDVANSLLRNLSMNAEEISELGRNPIKSHYTGVLEDIEIYRTVEMSELSPSLQKLVKAYEAPIKKKKEIYKKYGLDPATLPPTQKVGNVGKTKNVFDAVYIAFHIRYTDVMSIGDKVVFYSANKGILKYIIPDGQEPTTSFRPEEPIDAFVSVTSINARMVTSTVLYGSLAKLMVELDRTCKDMMEVPYTF